MAQPVRITDVDLAAVEKAEDAGHTSGDKGFMLLAVRQDACTQLAGTDSDYSPVSTDSDGKLWVQSVLSAGTASIGLTGHNITGIGHGVTVVTTAGTDVVLRSTTAAKLVIIQAKTNNTNKVAVGASGVDATVATGTGIILDPGDTITLPVDDLADIYIDALVSGEGVRYTYST